MYRYLASPVLAALVLVSYASVASAQHTDEEVVELRRRPQQEAVLDARRGDLDERSGLDVAWIPQARPPWEARTRSHPRPARGPAGAGWRPGAASCARSLSL